MKRKTSREAREIFDLSRDDVKRLEKDEVLNPEKSGQGVASLYNEQDMFRLMDIKMHMLAGYRIADMKDILTDDYDSEKGIDEQIHIYKRRILLLEFIKKIRADIQYMSETAPQIIINHTKKITEELQCPEYGTELYDDFMWDSIKLIFTLDYLCKKNSYRDIELSREKVKSVDSIIKKYLKIFKVEFDKSVMLSMVTDLLVSQDENEKDVLDDVREFVNDYKNKKDDILIYIEKEIINPLVNENTKESIEFFRAFLMHIYEFVLDYFIDEEELLNLYINIINIMSELDRKKLENGIIDF